MKRRNKNRPEFILIGKTKKDVQYFSKLFTLALLFFAPLMIILLALGGAI